MNSPVNSQPHSSLYIELHRLEALIEEVSCLTMQDGKICMDISTTMINLSLRYLNDQLELPYVNQHNSTLK